MGHVGLTRYRPGVRSFLRGFWNGHCLVIDILGSSGPDLGLEYGWLVAFHLGFSCFRSDLA